MLKLLHCSVQRRTSQPILVTMPRKVSVPTPVRDCSRCSVCAQLEVTAFQAECAKDLEAAEPVIAAAEKALNSLDKVWLVVHHASPPMCSIAIALACTGTVSDIPLLPACHTLN